MQIHVVLLCMSSSGDTEEVVSRVDLGSLLTSNAGPWEKKRVQVLVED